MKRLLFYLSLLAIAACQSEALEETASAIEIPGFYLDTLKSGPHTFENLTLYPVLAEDAWSAKNAIAARLVSLEIAIGDDRFRITEKKPFGRFNDRGAVNSLTVQNRSQDTVFLMAGDLIRGGRQDRVIAQDRIIPPRTITDMAVFCVEPNRWGYEEDGQPVEDRAARQDRKIFAFRGYYQVASIALRQTVKETGDQQAVWEIVGELTAMHQAKTPTGSYAGLEQSEQFTTNRDAYLDFFRQRFANRSDVVGVLALSGGQLLGADIFGHPDLFRRQYPALLHGYVTDALSAEHTPESMTVNPAELQTILHQQYREHPEHGFTYNGQLIHYFFTK